MNIGANILALRKQHGITQEELAAELGVTAAAVSKWEKGYTLPDILMLCALADHFQVTTDELLGRTKQFKYAVAAVSSPELGQKIAALAKGYGFVVKEFFSSYGEALKAAEADPAVTHLFASFDKPLEEHEKGETPDGLCSIESQADTEERVLSGFEIYLKNIPAYDALLQKKSTRA